MRGMAVRMQWIALLMQVTCTYGRIRVIRLLDTNTLRVRGRIYFSTCTWTSKWKRRSRRRLMTPRHWNRGNSPGSYHGWLQLTPSLATPWRNEWHWRAPRIGSCHHLPLASLGRARRVSPGAKGSRRSIGVEQLSRRASSQTVGSFTHVANAHDEREHAIELSTSTGPRTKSRHLGGGPGTLTRSVYIDWATFRTVQMFLCCSSIAVRRSDLTAWTPYERRLKKRAQETGRRRRHHRHPSTSYQQPCARRLLLLTAVHKPRSKNGALNPTRRLHAVLGIGPVSIPVLLSARFLRMQRGAPTSGTICDHLRFYGSLPVSKSHRYS